jgi:SAM-dependent methyltransferase
VPVWTDQERHDLQPIVDAVIDDLGPLEGARVLVLCSASGEVAEQIAERADRVQVVGLELDEGLLAVACHRNDRPNVLFEKALPDRIPFPDEFFDGVVSEFIVYPTSEATDIGQPEMARVLRHGGVLTITDVIVPSEPQPDVRLDLESAGLDYLCVGTPDEFDQWMCDANLTDITVEDLTPIVRAVWERRPGAEAVLRALRGGLTYIKVRGARP